MNVTQTKRRQSQGLPPRDEQIMDVPLNEPPQCSNSRNDMSARAVRILLVEDSPSDADLLQETLQATGADHYDFTRVERLGDALALLRAERFDVLLLDLSLPDSFGPDTYRRARREAPALPIVVLTGASGAMLGIEAIREGIQDYLAKGQADGLQIARSIRYAIERERAEKAARDNGRRAELLATTASRLLASEAPQQIVEDLCREVMAFLDCHVFFNFLVDEPSGRLHLNACAGVSIAERRQVEWLDVDAAVCGCVARTGKPLVVENIAASPDPRTELVKSLGVQAYCCHPLAARDRLLGTLSFGTRSRACFHPDEVALIKGVASLVAVAMERIRHEQALKKLAETLELRVAERTVDLRNTVGRLQDEIDERTRAERALRKSQAQLRRSESRFRLVAENVTDIVWTGTIGGVRGPLSVAAEKHDLLDPALLLDQWRYTFISPSVERALGYTSDEMMRLTPKEFLTEASCATLARMLSEELDAERAGNSDPHRQRTVELTHLTKSGESRCCEVTMAYLRGEDGRIVGMVGSTRDVTRRKDLEREISAAVVHEQMQIGQELHDGLGQELLGLGLMAKCLAKTLEAEGHAEAESARDLFGVAMDANDRVRTLIKGIRPVEVTAGGLAAALEDLATRTQRLSGLQCTFECRDAVEVQDSHAASQLFHIAQEAVRNAVKHSGAKRIAIGLAADGPQLKLWVEDHGLGLPTDADTAEGMGLRIMRYRAALIAGTLVVEPGSDGGTRVSCFLRLEHLR